MTKAQKLHFKTQAYSFVKTYATVFLGIFLYGYDQQMDVFSTAFLLDAAKVSLIALLRNAFKWLTEEPPAVNPTVKKLSK